MEVRRRRESNERIAQAWLTATLVRAKKMPTLKSLQRERKPQTPEQQFAIFAAMAKASKAGK